MPTHDVRPPAANEAARTDYLIVVATLSGADGHVDPSEIQALRNLAEHFRISPVALARVLKACESPPEDLRPILDRLSRTELRFSLLTDLCALAYVDGALVTAEVQQVRDFAERLKVPQAQADALLRFWGRIDRGRRSFQGLTPEALDEARAELTAAGVPLRAVAMSGAVLRDPLAL